jgi:hypothetical protein
MNWKRFLAIAFALLVASSLSSARLAAQTSTTGDVAGVVTDPSNAVVPEAKLNLKDNAKGNSQETKTNKDGGFHFYLLSPGSYTLTVAATGFQIQSLQVQVAVGQVATSNISLSLGSSTTTVTVTEVAPLIQTENGDTASSMSSQQIANVPNPGNDLSAIAQIAPGVVANTQGGMGNVEAFGMPATSNLFTINGMDDNDPFLNVNNSGSSNLLLGSNEMQEADVVTNGYSGSYGTFAGINVNYITKSGSNEFHGNAVYYWTGRAMDANDWINKVQGGSRPFNNANQWAASIGGPIMKDKLFFFLNTEGLRVLIPVPQDVLVPTIPFENATIANLNALGLTASLPYYCQNLATVTGCANVAGVPGSGGGLFNFYNGAKNQANAVPAPGGALGPNSTGGCSPNLPAPFGNGATPCVDLIHEIPINFAPEKQISGRADWNIGTNDRMFVRMQYDQGIQPTGTDPLNSVFNISSNQPEYQGQLNETHTFSPTLTNQFLMAATWYSAIFQAANTPSFLAAAPIQLDFQNFGDASLSDIGNVIGFVFPQGRNVTQIQFGDDVSKTIGNHSLKVGFNFHRDYVSDHDLGVTTNGVQISDITSFFNGAGDAVIKNFAQSQNVPIRINNIGAYVQDDWRVRSNFTLSAALRLEHNSNPTCATDCFATFAGGLGQALANVGAPYNSLIQTGRSQALYNFQAVQWEPRVSFAWQPFGSATGMLKSNLVIRGGIGIFYDAFPGQVADGMAENSPLVNAFVIGAGGAACPNGFLSPNQPGNFTDCASNANAAFNTAFTGGSGAVAAPPGIITAENHVQGPQYQKWSLQIQKAFGANNSFDIGYYGNHGIHEVVVNPSINASQFVNAAQGIDFVPPDLPAAPPLPQFAEVQLVGSNGVSNYNGLVASYKHRFSGWAGNGVVQLNYTYSHAFDEVSNGGFNSFSGSTLAPQDPFNLRGNYGPADYDVRHNFNANYVWEVPVRKALMGHGWVPLVDGWQVSGTVFARTGLPYTVHDTAFSGTLQDANYFSQLWPNILNPNTPTSCPNVEASVFFVAAPVPCRPASDFVASGAETGFGVQGLRNKFRGPDYVDTDFSFTKKTKIPRWERGEFQIGLQFFNFFNHPNFNFPNANVGSGLFGFTTSMVSPPTSILGSFLGGDASPRLIQLKAQLVF